MFQKKLFYFKRIHATLTSPEVFFFFLKAAYHYSFIIKARTCLVSNGNISSNDLLLMEVY